MKLYTQLLIGAGVILFIFLISSNQKMIYGIHTLSVINDTQYISQLDDLGVSMVREYMPWSYVEKSKGVYNYPIDKDVDKLLSHNINVLLRLDPGNSLYNNCTQESQGSISCNSWYVPSNKANFDNFLVAWGNYCYETVKHYKGKINYFEIHNEYNGEWQTLSNDIEQQYSQEVQILKACYTRGKQANSRAKFISGGLSTEDKVLKYIEGIYKYGGKNYFDILGVHPYCSYSSVSTNSSYYDAFNCTNLKNLQKVRQIMINYGDNNKNMWITETGYPTAGCIYYGKPNSYCPGNLSEDNQAQRIKAVMDSLSSYPYVKAVFWFTFRDRANINPGDTEHNFGIIHVNGTIKPSFNVYKQIIQQAK